MKLCNLKMGDILVADNGFTCMSAGERTVKSAPVGLYVECKDGKHFLDGQVNAAGELVGLHRA